MLLAKRLGGQRVKDALKLLDEGQLAEVAAMMLDYYDKLYEKWAAESRCRQRLHVDCPSIDAIDNARRVLEAVRDLSAPQDPKGPDPSPVEEMRTVHHEGQCHCALAFDYFNNSCLI